MIDDYPVDAGGQGIERFGGVSELWHSEPVRMSEVAVRSIIDAGRGQGGESEATLLDQFERGTGMIAHYEVAIVPLTGQALRERKASHYVSRADRIGGIDTEGKSHRQRTLNNGSSGSHSSNPEISPAASPPAISAKVLS